MMSSCSFKFAILILGMFVLCTTTSCGSKTDSGAGLAFSVTPSQTSIISAAGSNCSDRTAYKLATTTGSSSPVLSQSASAAHIVFANFNLSWTGDYPLTIASMTVKISSSKTQGSDQVVTIDSNELEDLLGLPLGVVQPGTTIFSNPATNDTKHAKGSAYAPCGLVIGGISNATPGAGSFIATVTITIDGTTAAADGTNEKYVRQRITAYANYDDPGL